MYPVIDLLFDISGSEDKMSNCGRVSRPATTKFGAAPDLPAFTAYQHGL